MTVPRNPELDFQIHLVERQSVQDMIDTTNRFGEQCPVCAISQSLYEFKRNRIGYEGCEASCPAFKHCETIIRARQDFIHTLENISFELRKEIAKHEGRSIDEH